MLTPRWIRVLFGRFGVGHSPSAHWSGGHYECKACPKRRQPR